MSALLIGNLKTTFEKRVDENDVLVERKQIVEFDMVSCEVNVQLAPPDPITGNYTMELDFQPNTQGGIPSSLVQHFKQEYDYDLYIDYKQPQTTTVVVRTHVDNTYMYQSESFTCDKEEKEVIKPAGD